VCDVCDVRMHHSDSTRGCTVETVMQTPKGGFFGTPKTKHPLSAERVRVVW
jgi:hypothetical protein